MKRLLIFLSAVLLVTNTWSASLTVGNPDPGRNAFPFGGAVGGAGTRYQQAYAASDFSSIGGPFAVTAINFLNGSGNLAPSTYSLYFSTISAGIDTLSNSNFDSNRGADNALFVSVTLSGTAPPTLTLSGTPFNYDPSRGNLLLDIVVSPGGVMANSGFGGSYMSNTNAFGVFSRYHDFGFANTGYGLVTRFDYVAVPEPSAAVLAGVGLLLTAYARRWLNYAFSRRGSLTLDSCFSSVRPSHPRAPIQLRAAEARQKLAEFGCQLPF